MGKEKKSCQVSPSPYIHQTATSLKNVNGLCHVRLGPPYVPRPCVQTDDRTYVGLTNEVHFPVL
jgi:hypothetical protein